MSEPKKEELLKWLITAMSHMKTIYEDNDIPWSAEDEAKFQAIYKLVGQQKPEVTEEWIQKAIDYIAKYPSYKRLEQKLIEAGVCVA